MSIKRDDGGGSTSRFRVTGVGVISESGDQGGGGAVSQRIVIDKIDQAGVTLTAILARREAGGPDDGVSKQLFVASGGEATVARVGDTTWSVRLEPPEE